MLISLPPRPNISLNSTSIQFKREIKLTPGHNPKSRRSLYIFKQKSRLQRLFLYKIINAVYFHLLISFKIFGALRFIPKLSLMYK